ncbi:hypothetical protein D3C73_1492510 [compost metagenome]
MIWIGAMFLVIIVFEWLNQRKAKVKRRDKWIVLGISVGLLLLSEVLFKLKDKWNVTMLFEFVGKSIDVWISG